MHALTIFAAVVGLVAAQQNNGLAGDTDPSPETCNCYLKLNTCRVAPNANQAQCSADFAACANYNPYAGNNTTSYFAKLQKACIPTSSTSTTTTCTEPAPSHTPDAESCNCYLKLGECQTAPDANQAYCASKFAACVGYNPYGQSSTEAYFAAFKKSCTPAGTTTSCSTTVSATTTPTAAPTPDAKTCACYSKLSQCQVGPNANQAQCASEFSACINYNPYAGSSAQVTAFFNALKQSCPAIGSSTSCSTTASATSSAVPTPNAKTCGCYSQLSKCQVGPNANQAQCASEFSACINYNPYAGSPAQVTAFFKSLEQGCSSTSTSTSCSTSASATTTATVVPTPNAKTCACYSKLSQCQVGANANQAQCAAEFSACINYNPYAGSSAQVTAFFNTLAQGCKSTSASSTVGTPLSQYPTGTGAIHRPSSSLTPYTGGVGKMAVSGSALVAGMAIALAL